MVKILPTSRHTLRMLVAASVCALVGLQLFGSLQFLSSSHTSAQIFTCAMVHYDGPVICPFKWVDLVGQWYSSLTAVPHVLVAYLIILVAFLMLFSHRALRIPLIYGSIPPRAPRTRTYQQPPLFTALAEAFAQGTIHSKAY